MTNEEEILLNSLTPFSAPTGTLNTHDWFDSSYSRAAKSPIDEFIENLYEINKLYLSSHNKGEYSAMLGSLSYLGMVSAAESYFRSLLRNLILVDPICQANAASRMVTYGAAVHHEKDLLPEALLENASFASKKNIATELKTLCNINKMTKDGGVPPQLQSLFENFESICQVRHCGIHRFGKLGSQQALKLGIGKHATLLEKPLKLSVAQLQDIAEALESLIKAVNSYCFNDIIRRTHTSGPGGREKQQYRDPWELDYEIDKERFSSYYDIFCTTKEPNKSPNMKSTYDAFISFIRDYDSKPFKPNNRTGNSSTSGVS